MKLSNVTLYVACLLSIFCQVNAQVASHKKSIVIKTTELKQKILSKKSDREKATAANNLKDTVSSLPETKKTIVSIIHQYSDHQTKSLSQHYVSRSYFLYR